MSQLKYRFQNFHKFIYIRFGSFENQFQSLSTKSAYNRELFLVAPSFIKTFNSHGHLSFLYHRHFEDISCNIFLILIHFFKFTFKIFIKICQHNKHSNSPNPFKMKFFHYISLFFICDININTCIILKLPLINR